MFTIVGLGNIGEEYVNTRHNVGWLVLEYFLNAHNFPSPVESGKVSGAISVGTMNGKEVQVLFPHTFMNNSGVAVQKALKENQGTANNLIVVHDEIDLPLGDVRIVTGRGSGGHNGIESVIKSLGSKDFIRVRVGVGEKNIFGMLKRPQGEALSKFVLGEFKKKELSVIETVSKKVDEAILSIMEGGVAKAMNEHNQKAS